MKRIGILGATGEIGKRVLKILKSENKYDILASYNTNKQESDGKCKFYQLNVYDTEKLKEFCEQCDVIVNCAGACYINGEKVARVAARLHIPLIDPSGESFLEDKIHDIKKENIFVLSSGYFPGMTGLLMRYICEKFDEPKELYGMSVSEEIPSKSALEDFILTNIAGFGIALNYYENGELKRDERERIEIIRNKEYSFNNYYTVELDRIVKKFPLERANWYNEPFNYDIMQKMQEAVIKFGMKGYSKEYMKIITEMQEIFKKNLENKNAFNYVGIEGKGFVQNKNIYRKAEIVNEYSSEISAVIAAYAAKTVLNSKFKNGIYYAMDIIDAESLIKDLPKFNIKLDIIEKELERGMEQNEQYEEGQI